MQASVLVLALFPFFFVLCASQSAYPEGTRPYYEHLAFTGDPTTMFIGWFTEESTKTSSVRFGLGSSLSNIALGSFSFALLFLSPIPNDVLYYQGESTHYLIDYGYDHFALMSGLVAGKTYSYSVGDAEGGWGQSFQFIAGTKDSQPFSIAVVGDMGIDWSEATAKDLTALALNNRIDWLWHIGDISYADDHFWDYGYTWNYFFNMIRPISSKMPYMVLPGNHEYASKNPALYFFTKDFKVYNDKFRMPGNVSGSNTSMYHSFDYGLAHFVCVSTESSFAQAIESPNLFGDQLAWLEADLQNAALNRKARPWIIVGMHRPIYSASAGYSTNGIPINSDSSNSLDIQAVFEDLFNKYEVDVVFQAHLHAYERTLPMYANQATSQNYDNPPSPFYITTGNGGNIEGLVNDWNDPLPSWSATVSSEDFGYGTLTFVNSSQLVWQQFAAAKNQVIDKVILNKNH